MTGYPEFNGAHDMNHNLWMNYHPFGAVRHLDTTHRVSNNQVGRARTVKHGHTKIVSSQVEVVVFGRKTRMLPMEVEEVLEGPLILYRVVAEEAVEEAGLHP